MERISIRNDAGAEIDEIDFGVIELLIDPEVDPGPGGLLPTLWLHNDYDNVGGTTTATGIQIFPELQEIDGQPYRASGIVPLDAQWFQWRETGDIYDPTGGTSGGVPADYAARETQFLPFGALAKGLVKNIPPRFGRKLEFKAFPQTAGGSYPIRRIKLSLWVARLIASTDIHSEPRHGNYSVLRWERSRYGLVAGAENEGGARIKQHPTDAEAVLIEPATYKVLGWPVKSKLVAMPTLDNFDGDTVALTGGKQYVASYYKNPDRDFEDTGYTEVKGVQANAGFELPGDPPGENYVPIGQVSRIADADGGTLTSFVDLRTHDDGYVTFDGVDLDLELGAHMDAIAGLVNWEEGQNPFATLPPNARSTLIQSGQKLIDAVTGLVEPDQSIEGAATTDGTDTLQVDQRKIARAPSAYWARRTPLPFFALGDWADPGGRIPLIGRLVMRNAAGALPQTVQHAAGHRAYARIDAFTTFGTLRATGTKVTRGEHSGGLLDETASVTEDFLVNKADDWIVTKTRWAGTLGGGTGSPDVAFSAVGGLVANIESGIISLWQNSGRGFHVGSVLLQFQPTRPDATFRFRLYTIPKRGDIVTLFDTGILTGFDGTTPAGGAGSSSYEWQERELSEMPDGTVTEGLIEEPPHEAIVWPLSGGCGDMPWDGGEGVYAEATDVDGIAAIRGEMNFYPLVTP